MNSATYRAIFMLAAVLLTVSALAAGFRAKHVEDWSADEINILASMRLSELPPLPEDPSNAYESSTAAARLGKEIFFDSRFSRDGTVSCASCHAPDKQFQDGRPLARGVAAGTRRTMPIAGAAYSPFLFWDGRKDSLWAQALGPLEDPAEHGGNRVTFAQLLKAHYREAYEAIFGPMPQLLGLPNGASPLGTPAEQANWASMSEKDRQEVSRMFANMGKALAAYERTLQHGESRLDRYIEGLVRRDTKAAEQLSIQEKNGLRIFIGKGQCITCHNGPLLTDQHFHNTGVAPRRLGQPDLGRRPAIARVRNDEFNCLGRFSDAQPGQCEELNFLVKDDHAMDSAFKTPSLRGVALRPPYMHAGQLASLADVVRHYASAPRAAAGHTELKAVALSESEVQELVVFLGTLTAVSDADPKRDQHK